MPDRFRPTELLIAMAAGLVLAAASLAIGCSARAATCDVCKRDECSAMAFRIDYADGGHQVTCCPRCASHAVAEAGGRKVARLTARDFATGGEVDAQSAVYVEGSDVEHCKTMHEERSEPGCCRELAYDRCLPSLIAFGTRDAASAFAREHGGSIRRFDDLAFGKPDARAPR